MEKLTFDRLIGIGIVLIVLANALAFLFHAGILVNAAWVVYGGLCILHPVCPKRWKNSNLEKSALLGGAAGRCTLCSDWTSYLFRSVTGRNKQANVYGKQTDRGQADLRRICSD